jgi:WD repeat-containing protein 24
VEGISIFPHHAYWNDYCSVSLTIGSGYISASRNLNTTSNTNTQNNMNTTSSGGNLSRNKGSEKSRLHILSISASVTRLRWRPPAFDTFVVQEKDRHESQLAVATANKGASAGGSGAVALWSYYRPFMPLSVVDGHKELAVADFDWLDTPQNKSGQPTTGRSSSDSRRNRSHGPSSSRIHGSSSDADTGQFELGEADDADKDVGIWQHVLTVGRDGRCLLQSLARGMIYARHDRLFSHGRVFSTAFSSCP